MIIRSSQIEGLESHPLFGVLEGVESRSIHPDDFYEESMFHEISWVEMEPGASIPIHEHEGCEEVKIIVYGIGMYTIIFTSSHPSCSWIGIDAKR